MSDVTDGRAPAVAAAVWYAGNARDLPWRRPGTTPWAVLVSEVMLQQTPVARVLPVYAQWLERWPAPDALAADRAAEAIRVWGRLGYPRRALRLHACATAIVARHGGQVPARIADLLALPGIGTYTAHAVAAFAFAQRCPVVDTNVRRFVARAVLGEPDAGPVTTAADLRAVEALLPADPTEAARVSAAFMEIGAVLCTARSPACGRCPLRTSCAWRAKGAPLPDGPSRKPQAYAGTERQIRGALMAVLREAEGPVPRSRLDAAWHEPERRDRALATLLADGLAAEISPDLFTLAGG